MLSLKGQEETVEKGAMVWTKFKGLKMNTFLFGKTLIEFYKFHLKREVNAERKFLHPTPAPVFLLKGGGM